MHTHPLGNPGLLVSRRCGGPGTSTFEGEPARTNQGVEGVGRCDIPQLDDGLAIARAHWEAWLHA